MPSSSCARLYPLRILSRKWSYLVLRMLEKPMTFSDLKRGIRFATNSTLARELSFLAGEDLVVLKDTLYRRTAKGASLVDAVEPLAQWSTTCGIAPCSPSQRCTTCVNYPSAVGVRFASLRTSKGRA